MSLPRIGEFIYPWGNGHYSRMSRLDAELTNMIPDAETYVYSKGAIYERLLHNATHPERVGHIMMPTPIDGRMGPDLPRCMYNILLPTYGNPPLVKQIASYLKEEGRIYDAQKFDLVINDGDMGSNVIAERRGVPSLFVTNQFRPRLWASRFYFYPALEFVAHQIAKATRILVADSPPPYTMCELNLNFPAKVADKVTYVGHFTHKSVVVDHKTTDLQKMIDGVEFGYWMRTGNRSTNKGTGLLYEEAFVQPSMRYRRRIISHADPDVDTTVMDRKGRRYSISEAYDKKVDWLQIDVGFLSDDDKDAILDACQYAVVNGSHTVLGEILGGKGRPVVGMPIYDEHTNNLRWVQKRGLGVLAHNPREAAAGVEHILYDTERFAQAISEFQNNFDGNGAHNAAKIAAGMLEK